MPVKYIMFATILLLPLSLHVSQCTCRIHQEVWLEQLFRTFIGDRHYHHHSRPIENVENTTMRDLIEANVNITDLPLSVFTTPEITVCVANCTEAGSAEISLGDE